MAAPAIPALSRDPRTAELPARELNEATPAHELPEPTRLHGNEALPDPTSGWSPEEGQSRAVLKPGFVPDNAPELSVRAVSALLLYFQTQYGRERLENLWRRENLGLSLDYLAATTNFVSLNFLENLCELLVQETGDPRLCRKAGSFTARPEAIGFAFYAVKAFGSPRACYKKMIELSPTYNRVGEFSVEHIDDRRLTFTYRAHQPERNRNICELRMGQFASFPTIWNLPPAQVSELQCQVRGADCCRYHVTWHKPLVAWRRYAGALGGVAIGALAGSSGSVAPMEAIPFFGLLMGFAGAWLDSKSELRRKDDYLLSQSQGMEASARDLQQRYEEVFRANVELEQRVADRTHEISEARDSLELTNRKLEEALARQRELDRQKTQFFDNVSHELRTPLTLILLSLEAVIKNNRVDVPAWLRQYLDTIERSSVRLLKLINNLLDLAKLEAGKARLRYESVEMCSFLKAMLLPFQVLADEKGIRLSLEDSEVAPILVDAEKIDVVFQNLISNALKFTSSGGSVTVRVSEEINGIAVEITDTGIGIASQDLPVIFDRFAQADSSGIRRFGGTGIGLALVKETVELHGGQITVSSTLGEGSCFRISLPKGIAHVREELRERRSDDIPVWRDRRALSGDPVSMLRAKIGTDSEEKQMQGAPEEAVGLGKRRILVVEDDAAMRRFLITILRQQYAVFEAADGREGLEWARQHSPDLVLSDVVMPQMSGLQLTEALKRFEQTADIPVILLTARGEPDNAADGLGHGANDYVPKPFSPRELLARIETQLRLRDAARALAENERLASLGLLTSGFAHEVRNPLNGLLNALEPLRNAIKEGTGAGDAEVEDLVRMIQECGQRINHLSDSLLSFARPSQTFGPVNVPDSLDSTLQVLGWRMPPEVKVEKNYRCREPIFGDAGTLNEVWLNMLDNALRAVGSSGTIAIGTERANNNLLVTIVDSGCGIPRDKLRHIFEPFFSTRPAGEGVGLGLALCHRIILRHGGQIRAYSEPGQGTRFEVELPIPRPTAVAKLEEGAKTRTMS